MERFREARRNSESLPDIESPDFSPTPSPVGIHYPGPPGPRELPPRELPRHELDYPYNHLGIVVRPLELGHTDAEGANRNLAEHSAKYLDERRGGFVFVDWLSKPTSRVSVGLFMTVNQPHELVVIKRRLGVEFWQSGHFPGDDGEVRISTCPDPLRIRTLPCHRMETAARTPFVQTEAVMIHELGRMEDADAGYPPRPPFWMADKTFISKYYNGGTVLDLIYSYKNMGKSVPETFIWHYIAQMGRALCYLHTGNSPDPRFNAANAVGAFQEDMEDHPARKSVLKAGWQPIVHGAPNATHMYLHYPSEDEKYRSKALGNFSDSRPLIALGNFVGSSQATDAGWLRIANRLPPDMPEKETWVDKYEFAHTLWHLIFAFDPSVHHWERNPEYPEGHRMPRWKDFGPPRRSGDDARSPLVPQRSLFEEDVLRRDYSKELLAYADRFRYLLAAYPKDIEPTDLFQRLRFSNASDWARWPSNDQLYGETIMVADWKLWAATPHERDWENVKWTQDLLVDRPFRAPYRYP
ncbi:hypothetical protein QBC35DRAFT_389141, partial [Podospora australis]